MRTEKIIMILKRIFTAIFMVVFLTLIGWLIFEATRPEILPLGSPTPELQYFDGTKFLLLKADSTHNTMVVLFHRECEHCQYQLKQFNNYLNNFRDTKIFLLTTEKKFFENNGLKQWSTLVHAKNIHWGIVNRNEFMKKFGGIIFPSIFLFNRSAKLFDKIRGEVKLQKILKSLRNLGGPEHQISGHN